MQIPKITLDGDTIWTMRSLLKIYTIVLFKEEITDREAEVLSEYIVYGCNRKADKVIELNYGISGNNIKQIGSRLQKKGLLIPKKYRDVGRDMHPELEKIRELFLNKKEKFLLLQVWK
ncbi:MAG TPA: hypothetical protein VLA48_03190 [Nitrososphaeraceae archaeon]|nr:hypothetical protein [Nitrososphaeraceae archaeon]